MDKTCQIDKLGVVLNLIQIQCVTHCLVRDVWNDVDGDPFDCILLLCARNWLRVRVYACLFSWRKLLRRRVYTFLFSWRKLHFRFCFQVSVANSKFIFWYRGYIWKWNEVSSDLSSGAISIDCFLQLYFKNLSEKDKNEIAMGIKT